MTNHLLHGSIGCDGRRQRPFEDADMWVWLKPDQSFLAAFVPMEIHMADGCRTLSE
jgi:hypothetical protein